MTIPPEFSEVEHVQSVIRKWMNREIRDYFSDLGGDEWDPDLTTPRGALRYACEHKDADSLIMTQIRWQLFERIRLQRFQVPYYGIPITSFQEQRKFRPQIQLYFQEDLEDTIDTYAPVSGSISFRLMDHTEATLNPTVAQTLANRIENRFSDGGGYVWRKGKTMCTYTDWSRGYQLQLLARTENDARQLIDRVLYIQSDAPDWSKFNVNENAEPATAYPTVPEMDVIYGKSRRRPRKRPIADVRFQYATLNIHGLVNPVPLVDRSGIFPSALNL